MEPEGGRSEPAAMSLPGRGVAGHHLLPAGGGSAGAGIGISTQCSSAGADAPAAGDSKAESSVWHPGREIAERAGCTTRNITKLRQKALEKLRDLVGGGQPETTLPKTG